MGDEDRKEIQAKGIGNKLNRITVENFPNFEKEAIQVQLAFRTQNWQYHKRNNPRHIIVKTLKKKKNTKGTEHKILEPSREE
jgi:hypothetical protein